MLLFITKPRSQQAVHASACWPRAKTEVYNRRIRTWWVPPPYGFEITQTRRSMFSAWWTFSAFELPAGYGLTPVRVTHCLRESFKKNPIATWSACCAWNKCVVRASSVPRLCVVCAWFVLTRHFFSWTVQKGHRTRADSTYSTLTTHGVSIDQHPTACCSRKQLAFTALARRARRTPHVLWTYNAWCAHCTTPNSGRNKLMFTAHGDLTLYARCHHVPLTYHLRNVR